MNTVSIDYTNWRGERRERKIMPVRLEFTENVWHPISQWFIIARDIEDGKIKSFPCSSIHRWIEDSAT